MKFQTDSVDYKILVIGLEGSGKSSIINMIVNKEVYHNPDPTFGVDTIPFETSSVNAKTIIFYEIGGNISSRGLMSYYYNCQAVLYVLDSSKHQQFTKETYIEGKEDEEEEEEEEQEEKKQRYSYIDSRNGNLSPIPMNNSSQYSYDNAFNHNGFNHNTCNSSDESSSELSIDETPEPAPISQNTSLNGHEYYDNDKDTKSNHKNGNGVIKKPKKLKISSLINKFEKLDRKVANEKSQESINLNKKKSKKKKSSSVVTPPSINTQLSPRLSRHNSSKLNKLLGIEEEDIDEKDPSIAFSRSKSANIQDRPKSVPPMSRNLSSSPRNSFVDKFKRKRSSKKYHHKPQSSIGSITLDSDQLKYATNTTMVGSIQLKDGSDHLQPLTQHLSQCNSEQELISKINFELKDTDIPFLILYNKQDIKESFKKEDITKRMKYKKIIDKHRKFGIFECNYKDKEGINNGFNWLLKTLKDIKSMHKQYAKEIELLNRLSNIDLNIYGPNAKFPKCEVCNKACKHTGTSCTVCGKWYCQRDKLNKMLLRRSGNSKCKECVGQKSIFLEDTNDKKKRKQTK